MTPEEEKEQRLQLHRIAIAGLALFLGFELFSDTTWIHEIGQWDWNAEHKPVRWPIPWQVAFLTPFYSLFRRRKKVPEVVEIDQTGAQLLERPDRSSE